MNEDILVNARSLRTALEAWRQADWNWAREYSRVTDNWEDWDLAGDAIFEELEDALQEYDKSNNDNVIEQPAMVE